MSYDSKELTMQDSAPVMLFHFLQGVVLEGGSEWRLTSSGTLINRLSHDWTPAVIVPDKFGQTGDMPKDVLTIKLPISHALAQTFLGYVPDVVTSLTVYRTHADDSEAIVYWKGNVASPSTSGNVLSLECESIFSKLRRLGAGGIYSRTCRHALYGSGCQLDSDEFAETATVTAVSGGGQVLTITEADAMDSLVGGFFEAPDGTWRTITKHDGTSVTLMRRIKSLVDEMIAHPGGFEATVYPGCDHTFETCDETFVNLANFGGFPGIPELNPMGGNNVFQY